MLLATPEEMAALDRRTIEEAGIPGMVLMEVAGLGALAFFDEVTPDLSRRPAAVLCGSGNNAGDGFVIARHLHGRGARVLVVCLRDPARLAGDARTNFEIAGRLGVPVQVWDEAGDFEAQFAPVAAAGAVVDAILGTGLKSVVAGLYRRVIEAVNGLSVPVLAVDIPSGLDGATGRPLGAAVRATATATFGYAKVGHVAPPGDEYTGRLRVVEIGIPPVYAEGLSRLFLDDATCAGWLSPRPPDAHKGAAGHVLALAGSIGRTGAAALLCEGAARAGAGLVTLCIPGSLNAMMEVKLTEPMTVPIPETPEHTPGMSSLPVIMKALEGKRVLAVGPGVSLNQQTRGLVRRLATDAPCPLVCDADALTAIAEDTSVVKRAAHRPILTPHPGEMARLLKTTPEAVQADRIGCAERFARACNCIVVLKGHRTIVCAPDGRLAVNGSGNPGMASGGMGDVLTGIVAAFVAQGVPAFEAACLGAYVHGAAGDAAACGAGSRGLIASDLLPHIPRVIGRLEALS